MFTQRQTGFKCNLRKFCVRDSTCLWIGRAIVLKCYCRKGEGDYELPEIGTLARVSRKTNTKMPGETLLVPLSDQ